MSRQRVDFDERDADGVVDAADVGGVAAGGEVHDEDGVFRAEGKGEGADGAEQGRREGGEEA